MLSLIMYFVIPLYKLTALYMYCIKKVQLYENHIHHLYPSTWKEVRRNPLFRKVGIWKEKREREGNKVINCGKMVLIQFGKLQLTRSRKGQRKQRERKDYNTRRKEKLLNKITFKIQ